MWISVVTAATRSQGCYAGLDCARSGPLSVRGNPPVVARRVDELRLSIQNRPVTRASSSITSIALALVLVTGASTNGLWATFRSRHSALNIASQRHVRDGLGSGDGVRNQTPVATPRLIEGTAVTVGRIRVVYPRSAAVTPANLRLVTTTTKLLDTSNPTERHDPPHLHAFSLLI
jgi:hypothetical protein